MKSTFLRVFLVVLFSNMVVVTIGLGIVNFVQDQDEVSADLLGDVGVTLVSTYESSGVGALEEEAAKYEKKLQGSIFIYQENGRPLLRPLPRNFRESPDSGDPMDDGSAQASADARRSQFIQVIGASNTQYLLVFRPLDKAGPVSPWAITLLSLLGLLVSSAILAYWLLGPLLKLQKITRLFGQGDMTARVDQRLVDRNDAIGNLAREFNEMAGRIETLLSSKERLLRDVSHELRTPLARIEVALTIAEDKQGQEVQQNYLHRIRNELHELDELIGQVLTLSRLEAASMQKEQIKVQPWLDDIVADVQFESQLRGISIARTGDAPKLLYGDSVQLRHAVENVLRNACFYSGDNSRVELSSDVVDGRAVISIKDNGPGVADEMLDKIFHAFFRSSSARESNSGGFGVGLTIAKRIAQAHNGEIQAFNRPEGGLEVRFCLPV
ncbi:HAMP domain-containing sensor histidine kinase [Marinomonas ostreistagni]|uniref:HAMP domain-containing sensor histidine kinase n=1 Tax=Marinomonas ostreistagni TaxID=359209 RepID=UPI00194E91E5|nr:ATP-binding protein [Marinomonas ostreistagni]MBM6549740.1 two-component sensor histidine kinase [Marinomonas ostreistagni]